MTETWDIHPLGPEEAEAICRWTYPAPYDLYSLSPSDELREELLAGDYYGCCREGQLLGYFCYGSAATIPTVESSPYGGEALDIGLGLAPACCGQGLGRAFLQAGLDFGEKAFGPRGWRLTVADFNRRAQKVYEALGFVTVQKLTHRRSGQPFLLMEKR